MLTSTNTSHSSVTLMHAAMPSPFQMSQESSKQLRYGVPLKQRLNHFTWSWFACTMSTGAIASLLGQQPYTFSGLRTIGKIFFILDLALFLLFSCLITLRFVRNKGSLSRSLKHPDESFFFGTFWVSIALILYGIQLYGVPSTGPWLIKTLEVLFWAYAGCALLVAIFQYHLIFITNDLPVTKAMPVWILPVYPFLVLGPLAAVLEYNQPESSALPILIGGICFQGLGFTVAFIMLTIYVTRLINSDLPEPSKRPGMYIAVGPPAYTSNTLVALAMQAPKVIPATYLGITSVPTGDLWKAFGVPTGIFCWLLAFWFAALSTVSILTTVRQMHFTLNWWAFIFPNVGLAIALIQIGNALNSAGIKGVCSALTIVLVALWIFVALSNIRAVWKGAVLWPGKDEDKEEAAEDDVDKDEDRDENEGEREDV